MDATLYRYHGIAYTYADLQAAYRWQQAETHKAIDSGNYAAACDINNKDVREYLPQIAKPQHIMPPQAKPKRKPKRNLKPYQKFILVLCRLIVK